MLSLSFGQQKLPVDDFVVLEYDMHRMSWGEATIFIMQKKTAPRNWTNDDDSKVGNQPNDQPNDMITFSIQIIANSFWNNTDTKTVLLF